MHLEEFLQEQKRAPLAFNPTHTAPRAWENNHDDRLSQVLEHQMVTTVKLQRA